MTNPCKQNLLEQAELYFAGALSPQEAAEFEASLAMADSETQSIVREHGMVVEQLFQCIPPVIPGASVKQSLMDRICAAHNATGEVQKPASAAGDTGGDTGGKRVQVWKDWDQQDADTGLFTLRAGDGDWEETGVRGVLVKRLFVDRPNNRFTALVRMAPGSVYPRHRHDGPEECLVIEGDLHVGREIVMNTGDYQRASAGSDHVEQWTEGGCVLWISSSLSDEMDEFSAMSHHH